MSKAYLFIDGSGTDLFVSATYNGAIDTAIRLGYINRYNYIEGFGDTMPPSESHTGAPLSAHNGDNWEAAVRQMSRDVFNEFFEDIYQIEELEYYEE